MQFSLLWTNDHFSPHCQKWMGTVEGSGSGLKSYSVHEEQLPQIWHNILAFPHRLLCTWPPLKFLQDNFPQIFNSARLPLDSVISLPACSSKCYITEKDKKNTLYFSESWYWIYCRDREGGFRSESYESYLWKSVVEDTHSVTGASKYVPLNIEMEIDHPCELLMYLTCSKKMRKSVSCCAGIL
jgi:hypothetical protein